MAVECYSYNHNEGNKCAFKEVDEEEEEEEDYIDMEMSSFTQIYSKNTPSSSPQQPPEFEFNMSSVTVDKETTASPADELFYKGKLLPLHLPPRLQMVEKLLLGSPSKSHFDKFNEVYKSKFNEVYSTPVGTNTAATPTTSSPYESCNASPVESCQVSRELNPEEYLRDYASEVQKGFISNNTKKSWTKKLKTKFKSLFGKSGCSDESFDTKNKEVLSLKVKEDHVELPTKATNNTPFGQIPSVVPKQGVICHRRSFSGAFKRRSSTTKLSSSTSSGSSCSSSSYASSNGSNSSNTFNEQQHLKRSSSANSEIETSLIQGAIAHCKQSQQVIRSRKILSEVGCQSFPSKFVSYDQTNARGLCRG